MEHLGQFVTNHWELFLTLISIVALIFLNELFNQRNRGKELSPAAAVDMINHENAVVIDLREPEIFRAGHIIDAIRASADDFSQARITKYKKKPIILVCARGISSVALATKLRAEGYEQPMVLKGGFTAWQTAGLPIVKAGKKA